MNETTPILSVETLKQAQALATASNIPIIDALSTLTEKTKAMALAELASAFGLSCIGMTDMQQSSVAAEYASLAQFLRRQCLLVRVNESLIGCISDPFDSDAQQWLSSLTNAAVEFRLALPTDIKACLAQMENKARAIDQPSRSTTPQAMRRQRNDIEQLSLRSISEDSSPIVRLVNSTLYDALKAGASDIHLECSPTGMIVRNRIDGVLEQVTAVDGIETTEQAISRIKVLAELDIAERRVPQDGRFRVNINERDVDIRVSIMPSVHGEDAVLRLLDKRTFLDDDEKLRLDVLGFDPQSLATIRKLAREPYGMLLVTGPTGSGKTTTLYAAISEINHGNDKIVTIEDPVEYELPGVLQIPVNDKKGLTFARGLRSILRHDPDKIMVGEIRDRDTAEIAVQSALTGHLVLTTVHANNVFDVFNRFTHMGIDGYALTSALNGIWAQRLLRVICDSCATPHRPTDDELRNHGLAPQDVVGYELKIGSGCGRCRGSGYRGRKAIAEILCLNDELREMIATRQPIASVKEAARRNGTRTLRESALALLARGETTLEEIGRVTLSA